MGSEVHSKLSGGGKRSCKVRAGRHAWVLGVGQVAEGTVRAGGSPQNRAGRGSVGKTQQHGLGRAGRCCNGGQAVTAGLGWGLRLLLRPQPWFHRPVGIEPVTTPFSASAISCSHRNEACEHSTETLVENAQSGQYTFDSFISGSWVGRLALGFKWQSLPRTQASLPLHTSPVGSHPR